MWRSYKYVYYSAFILLGDVMSKLNLLPNQKICLSIEEAAEYAMLGENRLRKIIEEDKTLDWVLFI